MFHLSLSRSVSAALTLALLGALAAVAEDVAAKAEAPKVSATTPALTLAEKKQIKAIEGNLDYYVGSMKEHCGFAPTVVWSTFIADKKFEGPGSTIASACQGAIQGAIEICQDADGGPAFKAKVKQLRCSHVADRKKTGLAIVDGAFDVHVTIDDTGAGSKPAAYLAPDRSAAVRFLEKNL